ncbi:hypothetical protein ScPMuIL_006105 [Solemya velum]
MPIGDLNNRTGHEADFTDADKLSNDISIKLNNIISYVEDGDTKQHSEDNVCYTFSRRLLDLELCKNLIIRFLGGRTGGDEDDNVTFYNSRGLSLIDYAVMCDIYFLVLLILSAVSAFSNFSSSNLWNVVFEIENGYSDLIDRPVNNPYEAKNYLVRYGYFELASSWKNPTQAEYRLRTAILDFQNMAHLEKTGILDRPTMDMMGRNRCGNTDVQPKYVARRKRFATIGTRFPSTNITYRIDAYTNDLPKDVVDRTIEKAFRVWSSVTPLKFTKKEKGDVDITLNFVTGSHGDGKPFDGVGGNLAHAFYPSKSGKNEGIFGDVHLDDAEKWVANSNGTGEQLFCVALHEIGHSLGLKHSRANDSVMWPWIESCDYNATLAADDIRGIMSIYGDPIPKITTQKLAKTTRSHRTGATPPTKLHTTAQAAHPTTGHQPATASEPTTASTTPLCLNHTTEQRPMREANTSVTVAITKATSTSGTITTPMTGTSATSIDITTTTAAIPTTETWSTIQFPCDGLLDAITVGADSMIYGFKGGLVFQFDYDGVAPAYPKAISDVFIDGPETVDAAISVRVNRSDKSQHTLLFKGDLVWIFLPVTSKIHNKSTFRQITDSPRPITNVIKRIRLGRVDTAFSWGSMDSFYLKRGGSVVEVKFNKKGNLQADKQKRVMQDANLKYLPRFDKAFRMEDAIYLFEHSFYYRLRKIDGKHWFRDLGPMDSAWPWFRCVKEKEPVTEEAESDKIFYDMFMDFF